MSLGQTLAPANVRVGHDVWSFNEASAGVACLAHTNDGFLWLGGQGGLFRSDRMRFGLFNSPFSRVARGTISGRMIDTSGRALGVDR